MNILRVLPLLVASGLLVGGCGGDHSRTVPANAVAVVGGEAVTGAQLHQRIASARREYEAKHVPFPDRGTSAYSSLVAQAVADLVRQVELEQKARDLGLTVGAGEIRRRLLQIKKQFFSGNDAQYRKQLAAQGLTVADLRRNVRVQILSEKLARDVTSHVRVTRSEIAAYYRQHVGEYTTPAERVVRHILVSTRQEADELEKQLRAGARFAVLARRYSTDSRTARAGGVLTITRGETPQPFDKVAFSLKPNVISPPVHTSFGWHIIEPISPITSAKRTPLASVETQIRETLLETKKATAMSRWNADLKREYAGKVTYRTGYGPAATGTTTG